VKKFGKAMRYRATTSHGDTCTVEADSEEEAAFSAVHEFIDRGVKPWSLEDLIPDAPQAGYDFVVGLDGKSGTGKWLEGDLFVGFIDETGLFPPCSCCGGPMTVCFQLVDSNSEAACA
jgi:hypothetical protein